MRSSRVVSLGVVVITGLMSLSCEDDPKDLVSSDLAPGTSAGAAGAAGGVPAAGVDPQGLKLRIEDGELEGSLTQSQVRSFLGVPYAKPPLGELRWKAPQKLDPWTGVRPAKEFGGRCAQLASAVLMNAASENEDCLYLNVWAPAAAAGQKLPVMFWIHGGGNVNGSTSEPVPYVNSGVFYSGETLAQKGVIVVSLNYRLGVMGFLAHADLTAEGSKSGNQGLWDQQFALEWVKRNVASFGGDPENVTIFGESAGSFDVCMHVASPKSRGLFHRAVSQSGGCTTFQPTLQTALQSSEQLAAAVGCSGATSLACLRDKPVTQLLSALPGASGSNPFNPIVDGEFLPDQPRALYDRGDIAKVPYILGSNTDEGTLFTLSLSSITTDEAYRAALSTRFSAVVDQVVQQYPVSNFMSAMNPYQAALARVFGDALLVCSTWDTAVRAAKAGSATYMYNFDIAANVAGLGATHGSELVYVFGTAPSLTPEQQSASNQMQSYWTNLAKTGDPNAAPLPTWPAFSEASDARVNFSLQPSVVQDFRSRECKFWQAQYDSRFAAEGG